MAGKFSKEIQDAQNKLKALKKELEAFDDVNINIFDESSEDLTELNTQIKSAKALLNDLKPDLDYINKSFNDSLQSLTRQNHYLNLQKKGLRGIASQASHIADIKAGEVDTDEKSIKKSQQKHKQYLEDLNLAKRREGISESELEFLNKQIQDASVVEKGFEEVLETHKEINKQLGIAPKLASGLDKALQKMGLPSFGIDEAIKETHRLGQAAKETGDKGFKPMSKFLGQVGGNLKSSLSKANLLQAALTLIVNGLLTADKATGELAQGLGMSFSRASAMRTQFTNIANDAGDINVSIKGLQESQLAIGKALGTNAMLNKEDLKTMTEIVKKTGLQHDELIGIEKLSLATGKSLDDNVKSALGGATAYASQNKLVVDNNRVLREVNKASDALKLSLGGSVEALGEAVVKAQQFGFNLEQAESIASSMLDFESSIENELSAELLTGKQLNLERARQLALEGDIASAAAEVADQLGNSEEFGKMNVIQQEALAKSVGLTRDQLASSLIEREALAKMSMVEGETALERYNMLKAQGKTEAEIVQLLGEKTASQLEQQSNQDKFNAMVEKLQEIFVQVGEALMPIFEIFSSIFEILGPIISAITKVLLPPIKLVSAIISTIIDGIKWIFTLGQSDFSSSKAAWSSFGSSMSSAIPGMSQGNDIFSPGGNSSGYGKRTLLGPEGAIQLNNKDTVIAGTNLFGDDIKSEPGKATEMKPAGSVQTGGPKVDMTQTNALLQQLINVIQSGGTVTLDGQKVGEALKLGSFQTQ